MRLWSIHPKYLDSKGLSGLWREALLAKKVLKGKTEKYKSHPQMNRFKGKPIAFIDMYLKYIYEESCRRGYCFDKTRIGRNFTKKRIKVNSGQISYEFEHLKKKLKVRDKKRYKALLKIKRIEANPLFSVKKGPVEDWEKVKN
jgi:hypothetical protein